MLQDIVNVQVLQYKVLLVQVKQASQLSIVTSIIIISISLLALYKLLNKAEMDDFNLDSIMFYWMVVNFLFITYYHVKVDRYFMPILPAAAYFMISSLHSNDSRDRLKLLMFLEGISDDL